MGVVFFLAFVLGIIPPLALGIISIVMNTSLILYKSDVLDVSLLKRVSNLNIFQGICSILGSIALILFPFFLLIFGCGIVILIMGILIKNNFKNECTDYKKKNISKYSLISLIMTIFEILIPVSYFLLGQITK